LGTPITAEKIIEAINNELSPLYITGVFEWVESNDPGAIKQCLDEADAGFLSKDPEKIRIAGIRFRNTMIEFIDRYKRAVHSRDARAFLKTLTVKGIK
jgi:hypothetical protein